MAGAPWSAGDHSYQTHFEYTYPGGTPEVLGNQFPLSVSEDAPLYEGYVLLRVGHILVRVAGPGPAHCQRLGGDTGLPAVVHPDQPLRFVYGWATDWTMTRQEAKALFDSMVVKGRLDEGAWVELEGHGIKPYGEKGLGPEQVDNCLCAFTVKD